MLDSGFGPTVPELSPLGVISEVVDSGSKDAVGLADSGGGNEPELVWPDVGDVVLAGRDSGDAEDKPLVSEGGATLTLDTENAGESLATSLDGGEGVNDNCEDGTPDGDRDDCSEPVDDVEGGLAVSLGWDDVLGRDEPLTSMDEAADSLDRSSEDGDGSSDGCDGAAELGWDGWDEVVLDGTTKLEPIVLPDDWALNDDGLLSPLDAWLDCSEDWREPGDDEPVDGGLESSLDSGEPLGWDD